MGSSILALTLLFSVTQSYAQLNFEGNPLTEFTEYTAEETQPSAISTNNVQISSKSSHYDVPQNIYPIYPSKVIPSVTPNLPNSPNNTSSISVERSVDLTSQLTNAKTQSNAQITENHHQVVVPYTTDQVKNEVFVQQQYPLISQQYQPQQQQFVIQQPHPQQQQFVIQQPHPQQQLYYPEKQEFQLPTQRQPPQFMVQQQYFPEKQQESPISSMALNSFLNSQTPEESRASLDNFLNSQRNQEQNHIEQFNSIEQPQMEQPQYQQQQPNFQVVQVPQNIQQQQQLYPQPNPVMPSGFHPRPNPYFARFPKHQGRLGLGRLPGKMMLPSQQRLTPPVLYKNPPPSYPAQPPKYKAPIEVIYTKPPGFNRPARNPAYEEPWFAGSERPSSKDVLWSQLYAQSYDPHYYNYIAKTGKIKPHLYGKLNDDPPPQDEGIWSDMLQGFKKHGLKNLMNPTFLLGMTIPALTLMLTALVQKRSFARADYGAPQVDQEKLNEYLGRLQQALKTYEEANQVKRRR